MAWQKPVCPFCEKRDYYSNGHTFFFIFQKGKIFIVPQCKSHFLKNEHKAEAFCSQDVVHASAVY